MFCHYCTIIFSHTYGLRCVGSDMQVPCWKTSIETHPKQSRMWRRTQYNKDDERKNKHEEQQDEKWSTIRKKPTQSAPFQSRPRGKAVWCRRGGAKAAPPDYSSVNGAHSSTLSGSFGMIGVLWILLSVSFFLLFVIHKSCTKQNIRKCCWKLMVRRRDSGDWPSNDTPVISIRQI